MEDKLSAVRRLGALLAACVLVATLWDRDHHPYIDVPLGLGCAVFLLAFAVDYLTRGKRTVGGALDRNAWMPSSWRKALFGSTGRERTM
jgi:hypothetical protein